MTFSRQPRNRLPLLADLARRPRASGGKVVEFAFCLPSIHTVRFETRAHGSGRSVAW